MSDCQWKQSNLMEMNKPVRKKKPKFAKSIPKKELLNKYVEYLVIAVKTTDRNTGRRCGKVIKIDGNTLTVVNAVGIKKRINPKDKNIVVKGAYTRKKGRFLPIDWGNP